MKQVLIDPPVSEAVAIGVKFAATAAAEPPELPPGTRLSPMGYAQGQEAIFIG